PQRPVELVAQASHRRLNVTGFCREGVKAWRRTGELIVLVLEGRVVIFESDDPVPGDAVLPAGADGPAVVPLGLRTATGQWDRIDDRQAVVHAGIAALHVEQVVADGVTSPAGDGRHRVGAPAELVVSRDTEDRVEQRSAGVEAGDGALETEHEVRGLPVITQLPAAEDARSVLAESLAGVQVRAPRRVRAVHPLLRGPRTAYIAADIEACPVEERFGEHRRLGVGSRAEIGSRTSPQHSADA